MSSGARARSLLRSVIRTLRTWPKEEREGLRRDAFRDFRADAHLTDQALVDQKLTEGEARLHYAIHYGVPYTKLEHVPTRHRIKPNEDLGVVPKGGDAYSNSKLAQAARRRAMKKQGA
mmetsp:Transcript_1064/g.3262  ORF Transcript_1064/g.3262 Transcript_1064/m.3262 type:complete len:118 (-) Transcript_1064:3325-3678(-)